MQQSDRVENIINTVQLSHRIKKLINETRKALQGIVLSDIPKLVAENNSQCAYDITGNLQHQLQSVHTKLEALLDKNKLISIGNDQLIDEFRHIKNIVKQTAGSQNEYLKYIHSDNNLIKHQNSMDTLLECLADAEKKLEKLDNIDLAQKIKSIDVGQLNGEVILHQQHYRAKPEAGKEMHFMIERVAKEQPFHTLRLNALQYATLLECTQAIVHFCKLLSEQDNPQSLRILGDYGVISLSFQNGSTKRVVPLVLDAFPDLTDDIALEAIHQGRFEVLQCVVDATRLIKDAPVRHARIQSLFEATLNVSSAESLETLLPKIKDAKSADQLLALKASLKAYCTPSEPNMLVLLPLIDQPDLKDIRDNDGRTLLHTLCSCNFDLPYIAQQLLQVEGFADITDNAGNLALHYAVKNNHIEMAKHLVDYCDINRLDADGNTALHLAIKSGNPDMINLLFMAGCDMHHKNAQMLSALEFARDQAIRKSELLELQEQTREDVASLKLIAETIRNQGNSYKIKGLLPSLLESLEVYQLEASDERRSSQKPNTTELLKSQEAIQKAISSDELSMQQRAELCGVDELIHQKSCESERLRLQVNAIDRTTKLVTHLSQAATQKSITPPLVGRKKIRYLVANGGGAKGSAHIGAFQLVDIDNLKGVAGTSAGGIFSLLVALGNSKEELRTKLNDLDFTQFLDDSNREFTKSVLHRIEEVKRLSDGKAGVWGTLSALSSLKSTLELAGNHSSGIFKGEKFCAWICDEIIEKTKDTDILDSINVELDDQDKKALNSLRQEEAERYVLRKKASMVTFSDLTKFENFLELKVYGTNIASKRSEEYSARATPNMTILSALRITMSLPLIFKPGFICERREYQGSENQIFHRSYQVDDIPRLDGGYFHNFPINAFDIDPHTGAELYNPETLGLCLVAPSQYGEFVRHEVASIDQVDEKSCLVFLLKLALAGILSQQDIFSKRGHDLERTAYLNTYDHGTLDFDASALAKSDMENRCGRHGVMHYFGAHAHTLEYVNLSDAIRKRLAKNGLRKNFTHHDHLHGRLEPLHILHPVEVLKIYAKASDQDLSLVRKLVNPNARDTNGMTALHLAHALGMQKTADRLRKANANPASVNSQGVRADTASWADLRQFVQVRQANHSDDQLGVLPAYLFRDGIPLDNAEALFSVNAKVRSRQNHVAEKQILDERIRLLQAQLDQQQQALDVSTQENERLTTRIAQNTKFELFQQYINEQVIKQLDDFAKADDIEESTKLALNAAKDELKNTLEGDLEQGVDANVSDGDRIAHLKVRLTQRINDIINGDVLNCKTLTESTGWRKFFGLLINLICVGLPYMLSEYHSVSFFKPRARPLLDLRDKINSFELRALMVH